MTRPSRAEHCVIANRVISAVIVGFLLVSYGHEPVYAQKAAPAKAAGALKDGWEEIDDRLIFLMVRLANVEASLEAVEKAIAANSRQISARTGDAKRAEKGNEMMD